MKLDDMIKELRVQRANSRSLGLSSLVTLKRMIPQIEEVIRSDGTFPPWLHDFHIEVGKLVETSARHDELATLERRLIDRGRKRKKAR